jgi:hypothetical protein
MQGMLGNSPLSDPMTRLMMGAAMMQGQNLGESLGNAFGVAGQSGMQKRQEQKEEAKRNQTMEWLKVNAPEQFAAVEAGIIDPATAWSETQKAKRPKEIAQYSMTPVYGTDANGNTVMGAVGNDGSFKQLDTGGFNVASGVDRVDVGTHYQLIDKRTGQMLGQVPKGNTQAEYDKAVGRELGEAQGAGLNAAAGNMSSADTALSIIDQITQSPNIDMGVGGTSIFNGLPGSPGKDFQNIVDQAKSGAFLTAIQEMKGLGALSNAEGSVATAAINRMDTATSKEAFLQAVSDYRAIVERAKERAQSRLSSPINAPLDRANNAGQAQGNKTSSGIGWKVEP